MIQHSDISNGNEMVHGWYICDTLLFHDIDNNFFFDAVMLNVAASNINSIGASINRANNY